MRQLTKMDVALILLLSALPLLLLPFIKYTGYMVYSVNGDANLTAWAGNNSASLFMQSETIDFYANYTNVSLGSAINNSNCTLRVYNLTNNLSYDMGFINDSTSNYRKSLSEDSLELPEGTFNYSVNCSMNGSLMTIATDSITVMQTNFTEWIGEDNGNFFNASDELAFYANYTWNSSNWSRINGAMCTLTIENTSGNQSYTMLEQSGGLFNYNLTASSLGVMNTTLNYTVNCSVNKTLIRHAEGNITLLEACSNSELDFTSQLGRTNLSNTTLNLYLQERNPDCSPCWLNYLKVSLYYNQSISGDTYADIDTSSPDDIPFSITPHLLGNFTFKLILDDNVESFSCMMKQSIEVSRYSVHPILNYTINVSDSMIINRSYTLSLVFNNSGDDPAINTAYYINSYNSSILSLNNQTNISDSILPATLYVVNYTLVPVSGGSLYIGTNEITYRGELSPYVPPAPAANSSLIHVNYNPLLSDLPNVTLVWGSNDTSISNSSINLSEGAGYFLDQDDYDSCSNVTWALNYTNANATLNVSGCVLNVTLYGNWTGVINATLNVTDFYQQNASRSFHVVASNSTLEVCNGIDDNGNGVVDDIARESCIPSVTLPSGYSDKGLMTNGSYFCANNEAVCRNYTVACCPNGYTCDPNGNLTYLTNGSWSSCVGYNATETPAARATETSSGGTHGTTVAHSDVQSQSPPAAVVTPPAVSQPVETPAATESPHTPQPAAKPLSSEELLVEKIFSSVSLSTSFQIADGRTQVNNRIKNMNLFDRNISLHSTIPKSIASSTDEIIPISNFSVVRRDPEIEFNRIIRSYGQDTLQYALGRELTEEEVKAIVSQIITDNVQDERQKALLLQKINETRLYTNISQSITKDLKNNKTTITIDIDLNKTAGTFGNVSIFQEIPKCLLKIINEQMIESESRNFEIVNADPLIVWHFDNLIDAQRIQYTINAVADENCTNQIKALAVAKDIILYDAGNRPVNYFNLWAAVSIIPLAALFLILFGVFSGKVEHEDEEIRKLTEYIRHHYRSGFSKDAVKQKLLQEGYPLRVIEECLELHTYSRLHYLFHRLEIGTEELILIVLIVFNILEFTEMLSGDQNYLQKVLSILVMAFLVYKSSITKIILGVRHRFIDGLIILAYTAMTTKELVNLARTSWNETRYVFDLYSYIINYNVIFERDVFIASILLLIAISIYIGLRMDVRAPSMMAASHISEGRPKSVIDHIARILLVHLFLIGFFVIVYSLMLEWLAVVIDSFISSMILIVMVVLIVKHWRKFRFGSFLEEVSSANERFYEKFIELFHYKKTIFLGISGMLILHVMTELGNFVVPYLVGLRIGELGTGDVYFAFLSRLPLFSIHGNSLFSVQTASFGLGLKSLVAFVYCMNIVGAVFLIVLPGLIWLNYFKHRKLPISDVQRFRLSQSREVNSLLFALFVASMVIMLVRPVFTISAMHSGENPVGTYSLFLSGVDILTHEVSLSNIQEIVAVALLSGLAFGLASYFAEYIINLLMMLFSYLFFGCYVYMFASSVIYTDTTANALLMIHHSSYFTAAYLIFFGAISIIFLYAAGFAITTYIYLPLSAKIFISRLPLLGGLFSTHHYHHIHHYEHHDSIKHAARDVVLREFILKSIDSGHELFYIVEHLVEKKWPLSLIEAAMHEALADPRYSHEIRRVSHYHHNRERIASLAGWMQRMYESYSLSDIIHVARQAGWSEDDIIIGFKSIERNIRLRSEDMEIAKYMYIAGEKQWQGK